jgi:hypothetical protein
MDLRVENSWEYQPEEWWTWSAYLKGGDLPKVEYVQYVLDRSFHPPVRKVTDSSNGFLLKDDAYLPFDMTAIVHTTDGGREVLRHKVKLETQPVKGRTDAA